MIQTGSIGELIFQFRNATNRRPVLLLGAGASYRSGIPLADEAVRRIARAHYAISQSWDWRSTDVSQEKFMAHLQAQEWLRKYDGRDLAEAFPAAVENMLSPKGYRREFLREMIKWKEISDGYVSLARLVERGFCKTILTTNFDSLIRDSINLFRPQIQTLDEINKTDQDLVTFDPYCAQIVYLHGAVEMYTDRISEDETTRPLNSDLVNHVRSILRVSPLIVIGYRGAEQTIMRNLLLDSTVSCNNFPFGIWWCVRKGKPAHANVEHLAQAIGGNLKVVEIDGFDELLNEIDSTLNGQSNIDTGKSQFETIYSQEAPDALQKLTTADLDEDLVRSFINKYCERNKLEISVDEYQGFLVQRGLLRETKNGVVPSASGFLLFGKEIDRVFPYCKVAVQIVDAEKPNSTVIEGNLATQFQLLFDLLTGPRINPEIVVKRTVLSETTSAYHPRAIRELIVNMLVHRDYSQREFSKVFIALGVDIKFVTPGGLVKTVLDAVHLDAERHFKPLRGVKEYRNPIIADLFYGAGYMEKAGTGLIETSQYMVDCGGAAEYSVTVDNSAMIAVLLQAKQVSIEQPKVATPIIATELYTTNLLPITLLPKKVFFVPITERKSDLSQQSTESPIYILDLKSAQKMVVSFADPQVLADHLYEILDLTGVQSFSIRECCEDRVKRNKLVWLLGEHWRRHLETFSKEGLYVEHHSMKKRAYFILRDGEVERKIKYLSEGGRRVPRTVVKRREGGRGYVFHENEGIAYSVEEVAEEWTIRIKPIYMFTGKDGITPLSGYRRGRLATRRFKFDRNKNVRDDLLFWSSILCMEKESLGIGGIGVSDLTIQRRYVECDIPIE